MNNIKPEETNTNGISSSPLPVSTCNDNHNNDEDKSKSYYAKLKGLNESVTDWIKKHVDENPFISLIPVFKDYEKYLKEIEELKSNTHNPSAKTEHTLVYQKNTCKTEQIEEQKTVAFNTNFQTTIKNVDKEQENNKSAATATTPKFTFGIPSGTTPSINFGSNASTTAFTFGGVTSTPCTFKNVAAPTVIAKTNDASNDAAEDEDNEPPKAEFKEVEEEGHIFKMRCKVFVKKDDSYADKGVGNLFLKPVPDKDKIQLIVRADTNLGNLLCNLILSEKIPIEKKGKRDVLLICLPTPEFTSPVPLLLRVKSPENAEELFQELEKNKR